MQKYFLACLLLIGIQCEAANEMPSRTAIQSAATALTLRTGDAPVTEIEVALTAAAKAAEMAKPTRQGLTRVGIVAKSAMKAQRLTWQASNGGYLTHLRIRAKNSAGVRAKLIFANGIALTQLRAVSADGGVVEVIDYPVLGEAQELWTPYTDGETQIVELFSATLPDKKNVLVSDVVHFDRSLLQSISSISLPPEAAVNTLAGICNPDVICTSNNTALDTAIAERKKSVARINFVSGSSSFFCSGTLLNSNQFPVPYFLTANHCISTAAEAASVLSRWFYEATACGGTFNGTTVQVGGGAQLVFTNEMLDSTLIRFFQAPPSGAVYAGWNAAPLVTGDAIVSISHPQADVMKFAQGTLSGLLRIGGFPIDMYSIKFSRGIIESGSSGSGLFTLTNGSLLLRGILSGSTTRFATNGLSCTNTSDFGLYGRFESFQPEISSILQNGIVDPISSEDVSQPGNTTRLIPLNGKLTAQIDYAGDVDAFRVVVPTAGILSAYSTGGIDLVGGLLDAAGTNIDANDDSQVKGNDFGISRQVAAGTYYVSVAHFLPTATSTAYEIHADFSTATTNYTDLWWIAAEAGWGINVNHQDNVLFSTLYTYDAAGNPLWLSATGILQTDGSYLGNLVASTQAAAFNPNAFNAATVARNIVGTMRLTFSTSGNGVLVYTYAGATVTKAITRSTFSTKPICSFSAFDRSYADNLQDLWWTPNESGWGINLAHQGNVIFATLFSYDSTGKALWLSSTANALGSSGATYSGILYSTTGPAFNASPFKSITSVNYTNVGTMRFDFTDGNTGTLTYSVNGVSIIKKITRLTFANPATSCTAP